MARRQNRAFQFLIYVLVRVAATVFQMFPIDANLRTARLMGWIWFRIMPRHRNRAREHLRLAFGSQLSHADTQRIALRSMQQMTMMAVESIFTPRLINEWTWPRYIRLTGMQQAADTLLRRRGAILLTGHYGNWELLGFVLATFGFPLTAVMRPLDNPYLNDFLTQVRARRGLQLLYKKGATQSAGEILSGGGILGFIADQNAGHKGQFVGILRQTRVHLQVDRRCWRWNTRSPSSWATAGAAANDSNTNAASIASSVPQEWEGRDDAMHWITQEYTRAIEAFVRAAPEQYLWIHRRWKSQPKKKIHHGDTETQRNAECEMRNAE